MEERLAAELLDAANNRGPPSRNARMSTRWLRPTRRLRIIAGNSALLELFPPGLMVQSVQVIFCWGFFSYTQVDFVYATSGSAKKYAQYRNHGTH